VATDWLLAEVADQRLLDFAMLIAQGFQLLIGGRLRSPSRNGCSFRNSE
jgi:hypothetical protein